MNMLKRFNAILEKVDEYWCLKTGNRYWYQIRLIYKSKSGVNVFDVVSSVGLVRKDMILYHREIKKMFQMDKHSKKKYLTNGTVNIEVISFLGKTTDRTKK